MTNTSTFTIAEFLDFLTEDTGLSHITYCDQFSSHSRYKPFNIDCVFTQAIPADNGSIRLIGNTCAMLITGITNIEFTPTDDNGGTAAIYCKKRPNSRIEHKLVFFISWK